MDDYNYYKMSYTDVCNTLNLLKILFDLYPQHFGGDDVKNILRLQNAWDKYTAALAYTE